MTLRAAPHDPEAAAPTTPEELLAYLEALGIATKTVSHVPVFTVDEGRALWATIPGGHCKNLFVKDEKGAIFLIVALEDTKIRLSQLHKRIGCRRLSFGRADLLMEVLGVAPGSVTPFALINDRARRVQVLLDRQMLAHERLNYHPLANDRTTTIRRDDLLLFLHRLGYRPRVVDLTGGEDAQPFFLPFPEENPT
jgi:Ala-tRNA(Pro) deacylase